LTIHQQDAFKIISNKCTLYFLHSSTVKTVQKIMQRDCELTVSFKYKLTNSLPPFSHHTRGLVLST